MKERIPSRRSLLTTAAAGTAALLAGCSDNQNNTTNGNQTNGNNTPENGEQIETNLRIDLRNQNFNNPIFNNYNTNQEHDTHEVPVEDIMQIHADTFQELSRRDDAITEFVNTITDDEEHQELKETLYSTPTDHPTLTEETWTNADPHNAIDMAHQYLQGLERRLQVGPHSARRTEYVTAMTEVFREHHPDQNIHAWEFTVDGTAHGNGLIYDEKTDRIHIFEPVDNYLADGETNQINPLVEDSNFFNENHEGNNIHHPLRFHTDRDTTGIRTFEQAKDRAAMMFGSITVPTGESLWSFGDEGDAALTTGYLEDVTEKIRNYNSNDVNFESLKVQSAVFYDLVEKEDDYIIAGTVDDPEVYKIEDENLIDEIWDDQTGEYDDLGSEMHEYETVNSLGFA